MKKSMRRSVLIVTTALGLSGCGMPYSGLWSEGFSEVEVPSLWHAPVAAPVQEASVVSSEGSDEDGKPQPLVAEKAETAPQDQVEALAYAENREALKGWWEGFADPVLDRLVMQALSTNSDRAAAAARIDEARGLRRSAWAALLPDLQANADKGRQDNGYYGMYDFSSATLDASFELDLFGKNRKQAQAQDAGLQAAMATYYDASVTLVAEVALTYSEYRAAQKLAALAADDVVILDQRRGLEQALLAQGEGTQGGLEQIEAQLHSAQAAAAQAARLVDTARLALTVLVGVMPQEVSALLAPKADEAVLAAVPGSDIKPLLLMPADVMTQRPDVQAAWANLAAQGALAESKAAEYFPSLSLSGFFGIAETALVSSATIWNVAAGAAVSVLDFGRLEGAVDAARAREKQAYEAYRKTLLAAVSEVETALSDYAHIHAGYVASSKAFENADRALGLAQALYQGGEVSQVEVLAARQTLNQASVALVEASLAQAQSVIRLYKAFGIY